MSFPITSRRLSLSCLLVAALVAAGCASTPKPLPMGDAIAAQAELSELTKLLDASGLRATLNQGGPYTVFAPTNAAIGALSANLRTEVANDPVRLRGVLTFHVIDKAVKAADVKNEAVKTLQGANLPLAKAGTFVTVDDAMVQKADLMATNGVIHTIDRVVLPPAPRR